MKSKIMLVLASCAMTGSFAANEGFYLGAQLGFAKTKDDARTVVAFKNPTVLTTATSNDGKGFTPRIYAGYQMNSYFGVEIGGAVYPTIDYDTAAATCIKPKRRLSAFDFSGKGTWDFGDSGFGIYGKAGLAYVTVEDTTNFDLDHPENACGATAGTNKTRKIRPQAGLGASYRITGNTAVDVSVNRIFKGSDFPSMDTVMIGFTYTFADPKCGQFLC